MQHYFLKQFVTGAVCLLYAMGALAQLPKRDFTLELRQIEEDAGAGYSVGTQARKPLLSPQQVRVRNGEQASLRMGQSIPMQWVQSVSAQSATLAAPGASAASSSAAVTNALSWMDSGQSLVVKPRWSGGKEDVVLEIEVESAALDARTGAELPNPSRSRFASTLSLPLGQWVTLAATGARAQSGVVSSQAADDTRRLLQIRVLAP